MTLTVDLGFYDPATFCFRWLDENGVEQKTQMELTVRGPGRIDRPRFLEIAVDGEVKFKIPAKPSQHG